MPVIHTRSKVSPEKETIVDDTWPFPQAPAPMDPPIPFEDFIEQIVDHNWTEFGDE